MRYTIIHHDVRDYFQLTPIQYMVCDSIHQLSHGAPTRKANREIARFLGIDEWSVRDAKKKLEEKGLVVQIEGGFTSTEKWNHVVTYLPVRGNPAEVRGNPESHNIYIKNNNTGESNDSHKVSVKVDEPPLTVVQTDEFGNNLPPPKPKKNPETEKRINAIIDWLVEYQGRDKLRFSRTKQKKAINQLIEMKVHPDEVKRVLMELTDSEYWRGRVEKPDFFTVVSVIQKRS